MSVCAIILTKNEEANIVAVIGNAQKLTNDILVVDSGSIDKTVELAERHGAKVVYRAWDNDFSAQRNFALEHIDTDWVLYLDADERMNRELVEAIKKLLLKMSRLCIALSVEIALLARILNMACLDRIP